MGFADRDPDFSLCVEWFDRSREVPPGRDVVDHRRVVSVSADELRKWVGSLVVQDFGDGPRAVGAVRWTRN